MAFKSKIAEYLQPEFQPVALVWSDSAPSDALQMKEGRFGCVVNLFAEASRRGRVSGGSLETIVCAGARAALGLGYDLVATPQQHEHYAAFFSKGLASARDREAYRTRIEAVRPSWRPLLEFGERRHCSFESAKRWLLEEMPRYEVPTKYVFFKPLHRVEEGDEVQAVIFPVNPIELAGLVTLVGSVVEGTNPIQIPPGADCFRIAGYACAQRDAESTRAILGMLDVDGREVMRRRFSDHTMTLTIPKALFDRIEREAPDSVFQIPGWVKLRAATRRSGR